MINPGNSGGPAVVEDKMIGVISGRSENIGYIRLFRDHGLPSQSHAGTDGAAHEREWHSAPGKRRCTIA